MQCCCLVSNRMSNKHYTTGHNTKPYDMTQHDTTQKDTKMEYIFKKAIFLSFCVVSCHVVYKTVTHVSNHVILIWHDTFGQSSVEWIDVSIIFLPKKTYWIRFYVCQNIKQVNILHKITYIQVLQHLQCTPLWKLIKYDLLSWLMSSWIQLTHAQ